MTRTIDTDRTGPADTARAFLDALAAQDFDRLAATCTDDVRLRAVLPGDTKEWEGAARVQATFARWFGDTEEFGLIDSGVETIDERLHMWWRVHVRAERVGEGDFVVEQQAYADTDASHRISHMWLACSGYRAEASPPAR